jgi:Ribbon-helix-helix domain
MQEEAVRWNIKVSKETDLTLRTYLGSQGMKKGDLSKFIEEAVRWRVFHRTVQTIKDQNAEMDPGELQSLIDSAVRQVRAERGVKRKVRKA